MSDLTNDVRTKVLIAEDDAIVALDLQGMVMRLGFDVVAIVETGQAAIAAVRRFQPDIILLDMILNGPLDGIDVAREIHKVLDVPVIFCVTSPDLPTLVRAKEISYAGYLLKPINPDSLSTTLDTVLYKYKLEKRVEQAEAKFRNLADKCTILQYFFDRKASFDWIWKPETGCSISGYEAEDGLPVEKLVEQIDSVVIAYSDGEPAAGRESDNQISALLEIFDGSGTRQAFALIGIRMPESGHLSGMLIPLDTGSR